MPTAPFLMAFSCIQQLTFLSNACHIYTHSPACLQHSPPYHQKTSPLPTCFFYCDALPLTVFLYVVFILCSRRRCRMRMPGSTTMSRPATPTCPPSPPSPTSPSCTRQVHSYTYTYITNIDIHRDVLVTHTHASLSPPHASPLSPPHMSQSPFLVSSNPPTLSSCVV